MYVFAALCQEVGAKLHSFGNQPSVMSQKERRLHHDLVAKLLPWDFFCLLITLQTNHSVLAAKWQQFSHSRLKTEG